MHDYDAIVIGARCAGASTALLLARSGYRVLLVDRATVLGDIPQGHFIHRDGPQRLARWGLLDRLASAGCPPIVSATFDLGDFPLTARDLVVNGVACGYGPRRAVLDRVLATAAAEAGAELRLGFAVDDVVVDGDRVVGITGRSRTGRTRCVEPARVVIGADGRHSTLASLINTPKYAAHPAAACWYFSYWADLVCDGLEYYCRSDRALFMHPTNDGLTALFVGCPAGDRPRSGAAIESHVMAALERIPSLGDRVRSGRRVERFYGAVDLPNFYRKPFGRGWALVGDAGCHKDPYLALGICDALRDVELLVEAIDAGFTGRSDLLKALAEYQRQRDALSRDDYQQNLHAALFKPPPPEVYRARAEVRGDQAATNRLFLAREGLIAETRRSAAQPTAPLVSESARKAASHPAEASTMRT